MSCDSSYEYIRIFSNDSAVFTRGRSPPGAHDDTQISGLLCLCFKIRWSEIPSVTEISKCRGRDTNNLFTIPISSTH